RHLHRRVGLACERQDPAPAPGIADEPCLGVERSFVEHDAPVDVGPRHDQLDAADVARCGAHRSKPCFQLCGAAKRWLRVHVPSSHVRSVRRGQGLVATLNDPSVEGPFSLCSLLVTMRAGCWYAVTELMPMTSSAATAARRPGTTKPGRPVVSATNITA